MVRLSQEFYRRCAKEVAVDLLGARLVCNITGERVAGIIVETEAYCDDLLPDLACHGDRANGGKPTPRTEVMFGPAGYAYVYFTYGVHWMFNIVTGNSEEANAVLIRALEPVEGFELMRQRRPGRKRREWTDGPAKLTQSLAIVGGLNGSCLFDSDGVIWLEESRKVPKTDVRNGPRIGLGKTPEPWLSIPWRYWIDDNDYVSR